MSRPFNDLSEGKDWFIGLLRRKGFDTILDTDILSPYYRWDLEAVHKGERFVFELKNRTFPSYEHNDVALSKEKYDILKESADRAVLVYFWTDKWCMVDVKKTSPTGEIARTSTRTTRFGNRDEWEHSLVTWKIQDIHLMDYE